MFSLSSLLLSLNIKSFKSNVRGIERGIERGIQSVFYRKRLIFVSNIKTGIMYYSTFGDGISLPVL